MPIGPPTADVTIRTATINDADAFGLITVSASLSAFIGNIPEDQLDFCWQPQDSADRWRTTLAEQTPSEHFLVADRDSQIIGFSWATTQRNGSVNEGEVRGLYVLPTWQRRGIGRVLLAETAACLKRHGTSSVVIACIKENPSCGFYRHLGGVEAYRKPNTVDNYQTEEIFFRWSNISLLIGAD